MQAWTILMMTDIKFVIDREDTWFYAFRVSLIATSSMWNNLKYLNSRKFYYNFLINIYEDKKINW